MIAYSIDYTVRNKPGQYSILIDAKDIKSAKKKIGRKHHYKDGKMIKIIKARVIGYF